MADVVSDLQKGDVEAAKAHAVETAEKAKDAALGAFEQAKELGFFSHFTEYNQELLTPGLKLMQNEQLAAQPDLKSKALYMVEAVKAEVMGHMTLDPPTPVDSFRLYNVLGFWIGVTESIIFSIFGHGIISLVWNGAVGYAIAYTLYWLMTCAKVPKLQFFALCFIALYVVFNCYMGLKYLIFVLPSALYFTKAFCDVLMAINGYKLYKQIAGDKLVPEMF